MATKEEQEILSKYVGWGGLSEVFDETKLEKFVTSITMIGTEVRFEFYNGVVLTRNITGTRIYKKDLNKIKELEDTKNEI